MSVKISKNLLWKAIKSQCQECVGWVDREVHLCTAPKCSLYSYRFGRTPRKDDLVYILNSVNKYKTVGSDEIQEIKR